VFKARNTLYARTYDTETKESSLNAVKYIPSIYIETPNESTIKSVFGDNLKEISFKTNKEYKETHSLYSSSNVKMYGNKSQEQGFIRDNWPVPTECDHKFHYWAWDIEVGNGDKYITENDISTNVIVNGKNKSLLLSQLNILEDKNIEYETTEDLSKYIFNKDSWKPQGEFGSTAVITSIQIYDSKHKEYYILGLNKEWENKNNLVDEYGKINYFRMADEESLLKEFLRLLAYKNPTILFGWNTSGYDVPYITTRIIRILDKETEIYSYDSKVQRWRFNTELLSGSYVSQLSPVSLIQHREVDTNYGVRDEFSWKGIFLEDYLDLYKKYTFTVHTSYSLDTVASYELGDNKVSHDDHLDFGEFYKKDFNTFIEYGIKDVNLLVSLDNKLLLLDLAKTIGYICGVTLDDIRGTVKQWNSLMFNTYKEHNMILPLETQFKTNDIELLMRSKDLNISEDLKEKFSRLLLDEDLHGQKFCGGITRGTGKFWQEVFSLDYGSLYPSCIQWANIGIDTLILPKDVPEELLELRAKYAIYYEKDCESKDLIKFDYEFIEKSIYNKDNAAEIERVLKKHNVTMTPNGMFFRSDRRSVLSLSMENIITKRKVHKKNMKNYLREIEELKAKKEKLENKLSQL